ncbi:MAG TPA: xanthine dehydrogenase [Oxalobacteraceae bacterium]|jgi:CO/xanthine dehydrogenase FAD-binding subunit|nr:xanthine dehydrogenase [Oxalobacteraceae bacterium]HCN87723.1 xanthine dehydrogenase [Oxalobacteraceae bacterium]
METRQLTATTGVYLRPQTIGEALKALATMPLTILAGGTDFYAARTGQAITEPVLDITAVPELQGIRDEGAQWRIGATVTWSNIVRADFPAQFRGLQAAARAVGGVQVQNTGTVAGNICNASPAADGIPALMALDARVEVSSLSETRIVPLTEFVLGSRKIARLPSELVTGILIPKRDRAKSSFLKLGHRRYLVISIAMVAAVIEIDTAGVITYAGVAVGSCSAAAKRLSALEQKLLGRQASRGLSALVEAHDLVALTPIDDVRGTGAYRRDAALTLVKRAIEEALHE